MDYSSERFSLKWNNFRSSLTEGFHDFLQEEMMVDVTLAAEGKFLQAHKLVLSVCSPYFKNLFNINPCKHPIVILKDVSHHELSYILQFMYKGEVGVKHEELPSFLKLADTLKLKGLAGIKVENEDNVYSSQRHSGITSIRKKRGIMCSGFYVDGTVPGSGTCRLKEMRVARQRKRRLSNALKSDAARSGQSKKLKAGTMEEERLCQNSSDNDCDADGENDALVKLIVDKDKDKGGDSSDARSSTDNVFDNEDAEEKTSADECDLSTSFFDGSTDTDQTPQVGKIFSKRRFQSLVWYYFQKGDGFVDCVICGKRLKGINSTNAEKHLKIHHNETYGTYLNWKCQEKAAEYTRREHKLEKNMYDRIYTEPSQLTMLNKFLKSEVTIYEPDSWCMNSFEDCEKCDSRQQRESRKPLWNYFARDSSCRLRCLSCGKTLKYIHGVSNLSNIVRHLRLHVQSYNNYKKERIAQGQWRKRVRHGGVDYQMIQTKRGKDMLLYDGYTFTQNRMCKDGMRWQCSFQKCRAYCRMSSAGWLTPHKTNHEHPKPSEEEIKKRILRMELKARAQSSGATPGEIIRNALPAEEYQTTDQRASYTRCIQRFRKSLQRKNSKAPDEVWPTTTDDPQKDAEKAIGPLSEERGPLPSKEGLKEEPLWTSHSESVQLQDNEDRQSVVELKDNHAKIGPFGM